MYGEALCVTVIPARVQCRLRDHTQPLCSRRSETGHHKVPSQVGGARYIPRLITLPVRMAHKSL